MGSASPPPAKILNKLEVAEYLRHTINRFWPDLPIDIFHKNTTEDILILIQSNEAGQLQCSVEYIYVNYLQDHTQLNALCEHFAQALRGILEPDPDAPTVLLPAIQNQSWLDKVEQERKKANVQEQSPTAFMPLVADLNIVFVLCKNQTCMFATEDLLAEFVNAELPHLTNLTAIETGVASLRNLIQDIQIEPTEAGYRIQLDHIFDTSLIMIYEDWEHLLDLQGEPVFALIGRDHFMVADSAKPEQVEQLKNLVKHAYPVTAYPLSSDLFTFEENHLVLYLRTIH